MTTVFIYGTCGQYGACVDALRAAGGRVILSRNLYRSFDCDALVLPGSGESHTGLDGAEHYLLQSFVSTARPVLGICRGLQALNLYFGGTLRPYIPGHQSTCGRLVHPTRADGILRAVLGDCPSVTSDHHQAADRLGQGLAVLQRSRDGTVEALCHLTRPILGVQWQPEQQSFALRREDAADASALFSYFLSL